MGRFALTVPSNHPGLVDETVLVTVDANRPKSAFGKVAISVPVRDRHLAIERSRVLQPAGLCQR